MKIKPKRYKMCKNEGPTFSPENRVWATNALSMTPLGTPCDLIFQLELTSHASRTFVLKNKVSGCLFFHGFSLFLVLRLASHPELPGYKVFVCFLNAFLNLFDTGLIYATEAPKNKSR